MWSGIQEKELLIKINKLALIAATFICGAAQSADLSFNTLRVAYTQFDTDCSSDCDGLNLAGGVAFNENFFGKLDYSRYNGDFGLTFVDVGYRWNLSDASAFFATLGYARIDTNSGDVSDPTIGLGLRGMVAPSFELEGNLRYITGSSGDGDAVAEFGGTYFFTETAGLNVALRGGDGFTGALVGARFNF